MFRYLRITLSALCGILCLLLVALWVRSYSWLDRVSIGRGKSVASVEGRLLANEVYNLNADRPLLMSSMVTRSWPGSITVWHVRQGALLPVGVGKSYPLWPSVAIAAALAAIPWTPRRFSLRTLLTTMTLVAVGLGLLIANFR